MEGFPARFHAFFWIGLITFAGPKEDVSEVLVKHELIHFDQARRGGWLLWNIRYYWYLAAVGYRLNPYKIEADERMHEPLTDEEVLLCKFLPAETMLRIFRTVERKYPLHKTRSR